MLVNVSLETSEREELYSNGTRVTMASRSTVSSQRFVLALLIVLECDYTYMLKPQDTIRVIARE